MKKKNPKHATRKYQLKPRFYICITIIFFAVLIIAFFLLKQNNPQKNDSTNPAEIVENLAENDLPATEETIIPEDISIKFTAVGDIMCHNSQYVDAYQSSSDTYDFSYVFSDIATYLSDADITVGNLETTFAGREVGYSSYPTFNTPEALGKNLQDVGFDALSTANNHSLDKGYKGLENTIHYLNQIQMDHFGTYQSEEEQEQILIKDVKGIKIAFLSYTYGTNGIPVPKGKEYCINLIDQEKIKSDLEKAKQLQPDLISVSMHWGDEYAQKPNQTQNELADFLFQNGVDIILGSHPHVLQKMEKRSVTLEDGSTKDGFVIYSLGNFISGQVKDYTKQSVILNLAITKHGEGNVTIDQVDYIPIYMYKGTSGTQKYKVMDIEKEITEYESGNKKIGDATYKTLKSELEHICQILGDEI